MEILLAKTAGFCFGVNRALQTVYAELEKGDIYTYGPIIHNKEVIQDLKSKGVKVIENLNEIKHDNATLIIRSHGISQSEYNMIVNKNVKFQDCTCPFVKKIHNLVNEHYLKGDKLVIIGNKTHPEVMGINGWCNNEAIIIDTLEQARLLLEDLNEHYIVVVQTTFSKDIFESMKEVFRQNTHKFIIYDTICNATTERQQEAMELSKKVDVMIVIGDKESSNTQKLYNICKEFCTKTHFIETIKDLQLNIFKKNDRIGVTAGASTPSVIIKEAINKMKDVIEKNEFEQMLDESFVTLHTRDRVVGTVIRVANEEVFVNLGFKSDGVIERGQFSSDPNVKPSECVKPGDEIEVFVIRVNDGEGNVLLSRKTIEAQKGWDELEKISEENQTVKGKFVEIVKGGMIALINGIRAFVPLSQVSNKYIENTESLKDFLNKEFDFKIIEFNRVKSKIVAGRKELAEQEANANKEKAFASLEIGKKVKATVRRLADFGAFVDLGGVDGLIHISEMSWDRITNPKQVLKEGQEVEVIVVDLNKEKGKISLSLKDPNKDPWVVSIDKYAVGSIVEGKVVRMTDFGAFVKLEDGMDGLVHISQISNKHITKPEDELKVGQVIKVKVLEINPEARKISLSKKEADEPVEEKAVTTEE